MLPDKDDLTWPIIIMAVSTAWDNVSHKTVLLIAGSIISVLLYWGFSTTFDRLKSIEGKQDAARIEAKADMKIIYDRDLSQDICITEIKEKQNHIVETINELKKNGVAK